MSFLIQQIDRIVDNLQGWSRNDPNFSEKYKIASVEAFQLLADYAPNTSFLHEISNVTRQNTHEANSKVLVAALRGFKSYVTNGLSNPVSLQRQAQITVVNDFLEQADLLLNDTKVHPAAPIVIIGASLEEFLRNWCIDAELLTDEVKGSIDKYVQLLRGKELINKQDAKDITSWGGLRNEAAHGHWQGAESRETARLMLMGVNLFMRKYAPESRTTNG